MSGNEPATTHEASVSTHAPERRIAFERLRERTDELELIVSGLLAFTLLALPSWLFDHWARAVVHAAGALQIAVTMAFNVGSGVCYTLAFAFLVHLAVRGYWIGLIGLKSVFPAGIRWHDLKLLGPVSREYHKARLSDLGTAIDRADRAASMLFAMAILMALLLLWSAVLLAVTSVIGIALSWLIGAQDRAVMLILSLIVGVLTLTSTAVSVLDAGLLRSRPHLETPRMRRLILRLLGLYGRVMPMRLILPVQLTLQSNLKARVFLVAFFAVLLLTPLVGLVHIVPARNFSVFGGYDWLDDAAVEQGLTGTHYENLRGERDVLLRYPMIQSDTIGDAYVRLFLPYLPGRDNPLLAQRCPAPQPSVAAKSTNAPDAAATASCIAGLWQVSFDGEPVTPEYLPAERRDLGMRGLTAYLPLADRTPGRHDLRVVWNDAGPAQGPARRREYRIPFWFAPAYELGLELPAAR